MKYFLIIIFIVILGGGIKADLKIDIEKNETTDKNEMNFENKNFENKNFENNTNDSDESEEEEKRVRILKELDVSALQDYCTPDGVCRNLIYDNPEEVVFFEDKTKVRFTSDSTYVLKPSPHYNVMKFVDSKFVNFPVNLFYALNVHELDMRDCDVSRVTWDNFLKADNLTILLLSRNRLREIKPLTFQSAENLSYLLLESNEIDTLHTQSFKDLSKLHMLDLHDNRLTSLPPGLFSYLTSLQQLNLMENRLTSITDGTFNNNIRLNSVYLANNFLNRIDEYVFQNQDYMDYIDLSDNPDLETLVGNIRVDNLWVRNCSLKRVNVYGKAKYVDLQQNHIMELYFSRPELLKSLRLRDNSLEQLASLREANNLIVFDVSNNPQLRTFPEEWQVDSLERLDLSNISLRSIPLTVIESPERLKTLNVSFNQLTHIDPYHFHYYEKLNHFYIHNNDWNCYNLQMFMDMVVRPYDISYNPDVYDEDFPGEYIGGIKCMYRLEESDGKEISDDSMGLAQKGGENINMSGLAEQMNEAPENSATTDESSEVEQLRKELKAIVNIYEQKFRLVLNKLNQLDQRLKLFEQFNKTMWNQVTITV